MTTKYYTHFLLRERIPRSTSEFRGVIELNRLLSPGNLTAAASVLAKNFECDSKDVKILQWSLLQ
jgi:hypothetical protein